MGSHSPALGACSAGAQGADVDQTPPEPTSHPQVRSPSGWASGGVLQEGRCSEAGRRPAPAALLGSPLPPTQLIGTPGTELPGGRRQVTGDKGGCCQHCSTEPSAAAQLPRGPSPPGSPPSSMVWVPGAGEGSGDATVTCPYCCHCRDGGHQGGGGSPGDSKDLCPVRLWAHSLGRHASLLGAEASTNSAPKAP